MSKYKLRETVCSRPGDGLMGRHGSYNYKSPSSKDLGQKYVQEKQPAQVKSPGKFNSFASAIGFKSKKNAHPTLTIQDPPASNGPPLPSPNPVSPVLSESTRPMSKAASSTRSRVDSLEPRTPVDYHRDKRQSLLTLSDVDPFAGRPMIAVPVPNLPSDPNRLSAYSNPSVTDFVHKKADVPTFNRVSYASSSSNSNNHGMELPFITPPVTAKPNSEFRPLHTKRSMGSLQIKRPEPLSRQASLNPSIDSTSRSGSSSTVAPGPSVNYSDSGSSRPKMRARGMTDSGSSQRAGFFVEERSSLRKVTQKSPSSTHLPPSPVIPGVPGPSASPRVVIRQASVSRLNTPPSAPPTHRLPPPPDPQSQEYGSQPSASSSSISFSSALSLTNDVVASPPPEKRPPERSPFSQITHDRDEHHSRFATTKESRTEPGSPRTLRKALSQSSLSRRNNTAPTPPTSKTPPQPPTEKVPRKQRSFHHPRLPIPPIPLPNRASSSSGSAIFPSMAELGNPAPVEPRRGGGHSFSGRKRLFSSHSSNNRPSTQPTPTSPTEDDKLSLFSLRSDNDSHLAPYKPWRSPTNQSTPSSSFWDEGSSDQMPSSPVRSIPDSYYTPQAIMSKAELAKLEASVESSPQFSARTRDRGFSILSASTMASDFDFDPILTGLSPPPPTSRPSSKQMSARMSSNSFGAKSTTSVPAPRPRSPPHSVLSRESVDVDVRVNSTSGQPMSSGVSLTTIRPSSPQYSVMTSLPPPPRRTRPILLSQPELPQSISSRAPSVQKASSIRSKVTVEKAMHRRSIMRKPSFLEIDDDTDQDTESECFDPRVAGSFLDLARESFDTTRSD
ncbi:hypothetical protein GALMADRAFT_360685 [Galerina marginata CBS 339.88]|uniref:Uncharacterized protein n=1 Tax=Galerina marginata (strain CBS 339.88) TaxID=685588 RepID=A0A067TZK4_GALM3|nr:hypothetical protein GALMADRAFT_360685 [Galerina marginata CBS 339.88]